MTTSSATLANPLAEPLLLSAPFALELARHACQQESDGHPCYQYHGYWQYLRLLGLGKTMSGFTQEFCGSVRAVLHACDPAPARILISGCADYSALAHVWHEAKAHHPAPEVVALDLCDTPLALTRWYARQVGARVRTVCCNVLAFDQGEFDLILTSSFFGYFAPVERERLFQGYADRLAAGGRLVFTSRLRPGPESEAVGFTPAQQVAFLEQVLALGEALPPEIALRPDEAEALARAYVRHKRSYPVNGEASLRRLAEGAGLQWLACEQRHSQSARPGVTGPTVGEADYVYVTLGKPA